MGRPGYEATRGCDSFYYNPRLIVMAEVCCSHLLQSLYFSTCVTPYFCLCVHDITVANKSHFNVTQLLLAFTCLIHSISGFLHALTECKHLTVASLPEIETIMPF